MKIKLLLLLSLMTFSLFGQKKTSFTVSGSCGMCADRIESIAQKTNYVQKATYDLLTEVLTVEYDARLDLKQLHQNIANAGHDTDLIKAPTDAYHQLPACCEYRISDDHGNEKMDQPSEANEQRDTQKISAFLTGHIFEETDGKEIPLIGANIQWSGATIGAVTDENGFFEIGRISRTNDLVISYVGFQSDTIDVEKTGLLKWTMNSGVQLDDVEVVYRESSTSVSFIDPLQITKMDERELCKAACCSLSESFETNPAVDASFTDAITGSRQIQMLGLAGKYVQITSEIIPDVRSTAVIDGLEYIPGPWIEKILLSKGAGSVAQGYESMTGQINVEIRKPETKERFYLNVYGNQGGRYEANIIGKHRVNKNWSTALLLHGKSQLQRHDRNEDGFLDMPLGQNLFIQNRWKYQNSNGWQGSASAKYVRSTGFSGQEGFQPGITDNNEIWGFEKEAERWEGWLKFGRYINPLSESSIGFQLSAKKYDDTRSYGKNLYEVTEQNLFASALYEQNLGRPEHKIKVGMQYHLDDYQEEFAPFDFDIEEHVIGAFAEYTYKPNDRFTAVLGQRLDQHNQIGLRYTPRLHLRYAITDNAVLRAVAGSGWRTPRVFAENAGLLANNRNWEIITQDSDLPYGLRPESNYNLGLNWTQNIRLGTRDAVLTMDYYYTVFTDQIVPDMESANDGRIIIRNQPGQTYAHSVQAQLDYEWLPQLSTRMAYRYNINRAEYGNELKTVPFNAFHRAFINAEYNIDEKWYFDATVQWTGTQRLPDTEWMSPENRLDEESEDYFMVMAQVRRFFNKNFEMYVGVENALNFQIDRPIVSASNPFSEDFDASLVWGPIFGRNVYVGLRYRFE